MAVRRIKSAGWGGVARRGRAGPLHVLFLHVPVSAGEGEVQSRTIREGVERGRGRSERGVYSGTAVSQGGVSETFIFCGALAGEGDGTDDDGLYEGELSG